MILKTSTNDCFSLTMKLNIFYNLEYMEITVTLRNLAKHTAQTKQFSANEFSDALRYYKHQEDMFL